MSEQISQDLPSDSVATQDDRFTPATKFWLLTALATIPFLIPYFFAAVNQEHFQYIPLVLVAVLGLAYLRHDGITTTPKKGFELTMLWTGFAFLLIGAFLHSSWVGAIAVVFLTISFLSCLKQNDLSSLVYLAAPMLLFIRLPQQRTYGLIVRLQTITTDLSSVVLDFLGVPNFVQGNTISLVGKELFVDEACSGVRSLFTLMFFAMVLLVYRKRSLWLMPLMLAIGVVLAVFGNMVRVTTIALAEAWFGYDLATGIQHDLLGHTTLVLSLLLMLSADRLVETIFHSISNEGEEQNPLITTWNYFFKDSGSASSFRGRVENRLADSSDMLAPPLKAFIGLSLAFAFWMVIAKARDYQAWPRLFAEEELLFEPSKNFLDSSSLPVETVSHEVHRNGSIATDERLGKNADVYMCNLSGRPGQFVISQPYVGWHELTTCYEALGWEKTSRQLVDVESNSPIIFSQFQRKDGTFGHLFFTGINADGSAPRSYKLSRMQDFFASFVPTIMDDPYEMTGLGQTMMLQYWNVANSPITKDEVKEIARTMAALQIRTLEAL